ncbi:MAG: hypothetical protein AB7L65_05895, partial [Hyphomonadaceae bacterium]
GDDARLQPGREGSARERRCGDYAPRRRMNPPRAPALSPAERRVLQALARGRRRADLERLFALIRREKNEALFAALAPVPAKARRADPLTHELTRLFQPILAPAAEKGDLLVQHMGALHKNAPRFEARGLAHAVRGLRTRFSEAQIRAGAKSLLEKLARDYSARETVS